MACGHRALGSSGGGGVQEVDFQEMDTAQNLLSATPPKETTFYGTNKVEWWQASPRGKLNRRGSRAPEGSRQEPALLPSPSRGSITKLGER